MEKGFVTEEPIGAGGEASLNAPKSFQQQQIRMECIDLQGLSSNISIITEFMTPTESKCYHDSFSEKLFIQNEF